MATPSVRFAGWVCVLVVAGAVAAPAALARASGAPAAVEQQGAPAPPPSATPAPAPADQTGAAASSTAAGTPPPAASGFSYDPQGRRDPFVSLVARGVETVAVGNRPRGLPGLLIGEAAVKGIVRNRTGFIAMVQGPDGKTHIVRPGDRLMDGRVKAIEQDTVVFSQDVNDPLSPVKEKEVRKTVRPAAEGERG